MDRKAELGPRFNTILAFVGALALSCSTPVLPQETAAEEPTTWPFEGHTKVPVLVKETRGLRILASCNDEPAIYEGYFILRPPTLEIDTRGVSVKPGKSIVIRLNLIVPEEEEEQVQLFDILISHYPRNTRAWFYGGVKDGNTNQIILLNGGLLRITVAEIGPGLTFEQLPTLSRSNVLVEQQVQMPDCSEDLTQIKPQV